MQGIHVKDLELVADVRLEGGKRRSARLGLALHRAVLIDPDARSVTEFRRLVGGEIGRHGIDHVE